MKIKEGYILKDVAGNKIVISTGSEGMSFNGVMTFNQVGAEIFELLDGTNTPEEIIDKIAEEYNAPKETVTRDFNNLVDKMRKYDLVED